MFWWSRIVQMAPRPRLRGYFANIPPSMYSFVRYNQNNSFHCEILIEALMFACKQAEKCFLIVVVIVGLLQRQQI